MTIQTAADALVIRDAAGDYYVITADLLDRTRASDEQRTALARTGEDTGAFGLIMNGLRRRGPFEVVGVAPLPIPAPQRGPSPEQSLRRIWPANIMNL